MRVKSILLIVVAFGLGSWMLQTGIQEYKASQRLAADGKVTTAQVLDRTVKIRSRGGDRYYLDLQFQTEAKQSVQGRVPVSKSAYLKAEIGGTVPVRYLPSKPAICAAGDPVPVWRGKFTSGAVLLVCGGVLLALSRRTLSTREAAKKVVESVGALCESHYEYAAVNAGEFGHLDLDWYDSSQRWLEQNGFAWLGDEENLTFRKISKDNRTLLRTLLGRDGTWIAYLYHFKPAGAARMIGPDGLKVLELQTQFANGTFLCTNNAEAAGKLDSAPGVDAQRLPAASSLEAIVAAHAQRVSECLAKNPGLAATRIGGLEDVHRAQNILQQMKATYRRNTGITKEELQRLAGNRLAPEQIDALHADVTRLHTERYRKAA